mmetsp:Transcript_19632/g.58207  ORF Transcript_19632/g.58207 Transcript_19632/m.58207 type:complete len:221 (-) Transcript_19632:138-800(-)
MDRARANHARADSLGAFEQISVRFEALVIRHDGQAHLVLPIRIVTPPAGSAPVTPSDNPAIDPLPKVRRGPRVVELHDLSLGTGGRALEKQQRDVILVCRLDVVLVASDSFHRDPPVAVVVVCSGHAVLVMFSQVVCADLQPPPAAGGRVGSPVVGIRPRHRFPVEAVCGRDCHVACDEHRATINARMVPAAEAHLVLVRCSGAGIPLEREGVGVVALVG